MAASVEGAEGVVTREVVLKVDMRFALIKVEPNAGEAADANFPRNLHNGAELFLRLGLTDRAERLRASTAAMLDIYSGSPDGKTTHDLGRGCVCWDCGHAALSKDGDKRKRCAHCGGDGQCNWLRVTKPASEQIIPWIQVKALNAAEADAAKCAAEAAKRREVEANVAATLEDRRGNATSTTASSKE